MSITFTNEEFKEIISSLDTLKFILNKKQKTEKPKIPLNAYFLFCNEVQKDITQKLKKDNPNINHIDITKKLGELWRNMSDKEKQKYIETEKISMEKYKQNFTQHITNIKPIRPYISFCNDNLDKVKQQLVKQNIELTRSNIKKELYKLWKNIPSQQKSQLLEKYKLSLQDYHNKKQ
jgi:hypothetical protein